MTQWQPIETAPKDGTRLLLWGVWAGEVNGMSDYAEILVGEWRFGRGDYPGFEWSVCGTDAYAAWMRPTHWMALPEAPA